MIEYCLRNVDREARDRLAARDDVREAPCLDRCGRCYAGPFLVVDRAVATGESHAAVLDALDGS